MKTNRIYRRGGAALALALVLAACTDLTGPGTGTSSGETIPPGMGLARIRLAAGGSAPSVRTALPDISTYYYTLDFTAPDKTPVSKQLDPPDTTLVVALEPALWTLAVMGYAESARTTPKVTGNVSVTVSEGTPASFDVSLSPDLSSGGTGSLSYSISFPAGVRGWLGLYPIDDTPGTSEEDDISSGAGGTASGTLIDVAAGSYRAVIDLYDSGSNKAAVWTEVVHIYGGAATPLARTFTGTDFIDCPGVVPGVTLTAKLTTALSSPSGSYTIVLEGTETDLAAFPSKTLDPPMLNRDITIIIRGNGNEVQLSGTGQIFYLNPTYSTSSITLVLQDVTLRGIPGNNESLIQLNDRGTLVMNAGSLITGNTSSQRSGGVSVYDNGTFTMNGGAISGNTTTDTYTGVGGGGVYVAGTSVAKFTMNGGTISGNTASVSHGGGVALNGGTFTMNGGAITDNNASTNGGGVYVGGTGLAKFTMSGGAITGNNASTGGGGVYVGGTSAPQFTMSGGAITDNEASTGGGVALNGGTFTMSGGAVSGNTTTGSSGGGGVYVGGTSAPLFTMIGGAVSGNTVTGASYGGGVYVDAGGSFTMSGGEISGGNTASWAGGVYVGGTSLARFTMSGGAITGNEASAYGGGVYVYSNGTFTMSGGAITGNEATSFSGGVYVYSGTFTMNGGEVRDNILTGTNGYGREVLLSNGTFKMSGDAQPERVFLYDNTRFITISGSLSGETVPIDLGITGSGLTEWGSKQILRLDTTSYPLGDLATLKTHFTLGNSRMTASPYTEEPITGYEIDDGGFFEAESP